MKDLLNHLILLNPKLNRMVKYPLQLHLQSYVPVEYDLLLKHLFRLGLTYQ